MTMEIPERCDICGADINEVNTEQAVEPGGIICKECLERNLRKGGETDEEQKHAPREQAGGP